MSFWGQGTAAMGWRSFSACALATEATMAIRYFALAYGIAFLLVGIAGFVPGLVTGPGPVTDAPAAAAETAGHLFGLFPAHPLPHVVHIVFGIWGLAAYRSLSGARLYGRSAAVIHAILAVVRKRVG